MTRQEFAVRSATDRCSGCGAPVVLEDNPNNGATQVVCSNRLCKLARRPWGLVVNIKKTTKKTRAPLPDGETLDSVWARWGDICFVCGATKSALAILGIGRQVHHVLPHRTHGHAGPLVPICTHCHPAVSERQRMYWFIQRLLTHADQSISGRSADVLESGLSPDSLRPSGEAPVGAVEGFSNDDADV